MTVRYKEVSRQSGARFVLSVFGLMAVLNSSLQGQGLRVIDETAIPFLGFLSKTDFDQRFPGELLSDSSILTSGWYVIYQHESLNYHFGPILLESTGKDYFAQFKETLEAAVSQRPSIEGYRLELSYEPTVATPSNEPSAESIPANPLPSQPEPKPSIWGFIKKLFGLG